MSYCSKYINNEFESNVYWALSYIWNDYIFIAFITICVFVVDFVGGSVKSSFYILNVG